MPTGPRNGTSRESASMSRILRSASVSALSAAATEGAIFEIAARSTLPSCGLNVLRLICFDRSTTGGRASLVIWSMTSDTFWTAEMFLPK